jgi:hypothetical protein
MALRVIPAPVGTHDIGAGFRQGAQNFGAGIAAGFQQRSFNKAREQEFLRQQQAVAAERARQQQAFQQDIAMLAAFQRQQQEAQQTQLAPGVHGPQVQQPSMSQLAMQTPQGQNLAFQVAASRMLPQRSISPSQQISQEKLNRIRTLQAIPEEQRTPEQKTSLKRLIEGQSAVQVNIGQERKVTNALAESKSFRADPRVKDFRVLQKQAERMEIAFKRAINPKNKNNVATDQVLINTLNKIIDENSVVRESEFARTGASAPARTVVKRFIDKLARGGAGISNEERKEIFEISQQFIEAGKLTFNQAYDEFSVRADEFGFNKRAIFGGAKKFDIDSEPFSRSRQPMTATNPQTGQRIQSLDGGQTWQPIR